MRIIRNASLLMIQLIQAFLHVLGTAFFITICQKILIIFINRLNTQIYNQRFILLNIGKNNNKNIKFIYQNPSKRL
jgi:hypothetical protein